MGKRLETDFNRTPLTQRKYLPTPTKTPEGGGRKEEELRRKKAQEFLREMDADEKIGEGRMKTSVSSHERVKGGKGNREIVYNFHNKVGKLEGQIEKMVDEVRRMKKDEYK